MKGFFWTPKQEPPRAESREPRLLPWLFYHTSLRLCCQVEGRTVWTPGEGAHRAAPGIRAGLSGLLTATSCRFWPQEPGCTCPGVGGGGPQLSANQTPLPPQEYWLLLLSPPPVSSVSRDKGLSTLTHEVQSSVYQIHVKITKITPQPHHR